MGTNEKITEFMLKSLDRQQISQYLLTWSQHERVYPWVSSRERESACLFVLYLSVFVHMSFCVSVCLFVCSCFRVLVCPCARMLVCSRARMSVCSCVRVSVHFCVLCVGLSMCWSVNVFSCVWVYVCSHLMTIHLSYLILAANLIIIKPLRWREGKIKQGTNKLINKTLSILISSSLLICAVQVSVVQRVAMNSHQLCRKKSVINSTDIYTVYEYFVIMRTFPLVYLIIS